MFNTVVVVENEMKVAVDTCVTDKVPWEFTKQNISMLNTEVQQLWRLNKVTGGWTCAKDKVSPKHVFVQNTMFKHRF